MIKICQSQWPSGLKFVSGWDPRLLGLVSSSRCILDKPSAAVAKRSHALAAGKGSHIEVMTKSPPVQL
jgi:hypothetical protein